MVCYDATYEGTRGELRYRSFWEKEANNQPTQSFWTQSSGNVVRQAPFPPSRGQQSALNAAIEWPGLVYGVKSMCCTVARADVWR